MLRDATAATTVAAQIAAWMRPPRIARAASRGGT